MFFTLCCVLLRGFNAVLRPFACSTKGSLSRGTGNKRTNERIYAVFLTQCCVLLLAAPEQIFRGGQEDYALLRPFACSTSVFTQCLHAAAEHTRLFDMCDVGLWPKNALLFDM